MKENELMIGNLIKINGLIKIVDERTIFDFEHDRRIKEPIPITEEWHNKFGIKKNGFNSFEYKIQNKINLDLTIIFTGDYVMIRQGENKRTGDDIISVWNKDLTNRDMYVHEWQNLYFALTGTHLTIK